MEFGGKFNATQKAHIASSHSYKKQKKKFTDPLII